MLLHIFVPVLVVAFSTSLGVLLYSVRKVAGSAGRFAGRREKPHREGGPGPRPKGGSSRSRHPNLDDGREACSTHRDLSSCIARRPCVHYKL